MGDKTLSNITTPTPQTIVVMFSSLTYLTLALAEMPDAPFGATLPGGWHTLHYADWLFATPLLLVRTGVARFKAFTL